MDPKLKEQLITFGHFYHVLERFYNNEQVKFRFGLKNDPYTKETLKKDLNQCCRNEEEKHWFLVGYVFGDEDVYEDIRGRLNLVSDVSENFLSWNLA